MIGDEGVGGAVLTPESIASPDAPKKMVGSAFIFEAENIDQCVSLSLHELYPWMLIYTRVWETIKNDVYYTSGVVCVNQYHHAC